MISKFGIGILFLCGLHSVLSVDYGYEDAELSSSRDSREEPPTYRDGDHDHGSRQEPQRNETDSEQQQFDECECLCPYRDQVFVYELNKCFYPTLLPLSDSQKKIVERSGNVHNPCGALQFLYKSKVFGVCDCARDGNGCGVGNNQTVFNRPVLNWPKERRCYYAYDQGPCEKGEWLVMNPKTYESECKSNPCLNLKLQKPIKDGLVSPKDPIEVFWFLKNKTCYQTFTQAFCEPGKYAFFPGTSMIPECRTKEQVQICVRGAGTTAKLPCAQSLKSINGDCVPAGVALE